MADEDAYEDSIYVFKASAPWNPHIPKPFRSFFQKSLISPAALCLPGACSLLRTRPSCSRTRPLRVLHARACPRMAEKAAKEEAIRVRKEEAFCTRKAREVEEQRRFNRAEARQARQVREDLIALQGRAERMVPTPFKVANEIRHARNLVSAWAGGGEEWW